MNPISIPAFPLLVSQKRICGSVIGSRGMIQAMLDFSARHGIAAKTEILTMSEVNKAIDKVRNNKARYSTWYLKMSFRTYRLGAVG